jgi:hypothetical protein
MVDASYPRTPPAVGDQRKPVDAGMNLMLQPHTIEKILFVDACTE